MPRPLLAAPLLAALAVAGCISSTAVDPLQATLQGTWSACASDGASDRLEVLTFVDDALEWTVSTHATADATCGGAETSASRVTGWYVIGDPLEVTLGGARVVARGLDVSDAVRTFYTTIWVDEAKTPRALHLGVPDPALGRDMTSGAKRPIVLSATPLAQR